MDALISLVAAPAAAEALKIWGAFAICLLLLGALCWILWGRLRSREAEIHALRSEAATAEEKLRAEITRLQELRLADAQKLIEVAKAGQQTMADRTQGDAVWTQVLAALYATVARRGDIDLPPGLTLPSPAALRSP